MECVYVHMCVHVCVHVRAYLDENPFCRRCTACAEEERRVSFIGEGGAAGPPVGE